MVLKYNSANWSISNFILYGDFRDTLTITRKQKGENDMIQKLDNGNTLITLGEGTVFTGNVYAPDEDKPFGIYFTNERGKSEDAVIINVSSKSGVASYIMALIRFLEEHADSEAKEFKKATEDLKTHLEPLLPKENRQM